MQTGGAISVDEIGLRVGRFGPFTVKTTFEPVFRRHDNELRIAALTAGARFLFAGRDAGAAAVEQLPAGQRESAAKMGLELAVRNRGNAGIEGLPLIIGAGLADDAAAIMAVLEDDLPFGDTEPARLVCELSSSNHASPDDFAGIAAALRQSGTGISIGGFAGSQADIEAVRVGRPEIVSVDSQWFGRVAAMAEAARLLPVLFHSLRASGALVHVGALNDDAQVMAAVAAGADLVSGAALGAPVLAGAAIDQVVIGLDQRAGVSGGITPLFA